MGRNIDAEHFDERVRLAVGVVFGDLTNDFKNGILATLEMLKTEPTAEAQPVVRGEWIPIGEVDKDNNQQVECSHCHAGDLHAVGVEVPYCWRCGARMVAE